MTVTPTPPPAGTFTPSQGSYSAPPPATATPPPQKSGCLKWFLIGCGSLIVLGLAFMVVLFFVVFAAIKHSDAYTTALERARTDPRVIAALGEPITPGFWVLGSMNLNNGKGNADFSFPVSGPKRNAKVRVVATTEGDKWEYSTLEVVPEGGSPINVLSP